MTEKNLQASATTFLEFPCAFTIKAFGKATPEYETAVLEIVKKQDGMALNLLNQMKKNKMLLVNYKLFFEIIR